MTDKTELTGLYCGIDPGREKFGAAITDSERLLLSAVVPISELKTFVRLLLRNEPNGILAWRAEGSNVNGQIKEIFIGDGTGSEIFTAELDSVGLSYSLIDEKMTTLEGRSLYWKLHPPTGLWRLVPLSLRVPPRAVDDLAAWAIVKKALLSGLI